MKGEQGYNSIFSPCLVKMDKNFWTSQKRKADQLFRMEGVVKKKDDK